MDKSYTPWPTLVGPPPSRRQELRFSAPRGLTCAVPGSTAKFAIRDISTGGVAIWSDRPLTWGWIHELTLSFGDLTVVTQALPVYRRRLDDGRWLMGVAFTRENEEDTAIDELMNTIAFHAIQITK